MTLLGDVGPPAGVMTGQECFDVWAPSDVAWSQWARPVVFANAPAMSTEPPLAPFSFEGMTTPRAWDATAIVVDLAGVDAVRAGIALAERGFRPVPLFGGTSGPQAVVPVEPIEQALGAGAVALRQIVIAADARPAFLIDANRNFPIDAGAPGRYDNRWVVLPQDFPSARFLREQGVKDVLLIRQKAWLPEQDLTHVLLRWKEGGLVLRALTIEDAEVHESLSLIVPSGFRRLWYGLIALAGLRRNNVGGFGSTVPENTQRSGFYG